MNHANERIFRLSIESHAHNVHRFTQLTMPGGRTSRVAQEHIIRIMVTSQSKSPTGRLLHLELDNQTRSTCECE